MIVFVERFCSNQVVLLQVIAMLDMVMKGTIILNSAVKTYYESLLLNLGL